MQRDVRAKLCVDTTAAVEVSAESTLLVALLHYNYSINFRKNHAKKFKFFKFFGFGYSDK